MTDAAARLASSLIADSRLPTGAYAHSGGFEPAVLAGLGVDDVLPFLLSRLRTVSRMEAAASVLAYRAALRAPDAGVGADFHVRAGAEFRVLAGALDARTPSAAQRDASRRLGRGLLRLLASIAPEAPAVVALGDAVPRPARPLALGVFGAVFGLDEAAVAHACCYDDAQSVVAAAQKLLPLDPMTGPRWLLSAADELDAVVREACAVNGTADLPAPSAPWMEHWAEQHVTRTKRLFVS